MRPPETNFEFVVRSVLAGGIAGAAAKTAVAPLDRVKLLLQTQHNDYRRFIGSWVGVGRALSAIFQNQGVLGLYRGHSLSLARSVPHAAIGYTVYESVRPILMPDKSKETSFRRMLAGSIAGVSALPIIYPFELVWVRLALDNRQSLSRPNLWNAFRMIYSEQTSPSVIARLSTFYRGFAVSLIGTVPHRGGIFLVWETLQAQSPRWFSLSFRDRHRHEINLVFGAAAGSMAQIITYPLEVVRRLQQASGGIYRTGFMGFGETVGTVWRQSGWRGFYIGLGIGLVKQVPLNSISFAVWQASKNFLAI